MLSPNPSRPSISLRIRPGGSRFRGLSGLVVLGGAWLTSYALAGELFVSPTGKDSNPGTAGQPLASFAAAQQRARALREENPDEAITVTFRGGTYYLPDTVTFTAADSGSAAAPVTYRAEPGRPVVISGGVALHPHWRPWRDGIVKTAVPADLQTDQLFINGEHMVLARYPNVDPHIRIFNGYAADAISKARAARWKNPAGGYIHAMHRSLWGDFSYRITGKDADGNLTYVGGWQNNRQMGMHKDYRFVENIFEELDAPREWYLDQAAHILYFYPPDGLNLAGATVETVRLKRLIVFQGSESAPVRHIRLEGFIFRHARRTFMETCEPLLRSDWRIAREAALYCEGAEDCVITRCYFDQVGGNAVFLSRYNRRVTVRNCEIDRAGASGVAVVGDPGAVRNPLFEYAQRLTSAELDLTPGPQTDNYPADCVIEDCLIHDTGRVEKQSAGVEIAMARRIRVEHCSIYGVPRAGINIGDGCWGGDIIEGCDVFDTVLETGDHGAFNAWGRDRWWGLTDLKNATLGGRLDLPRLDAVEPIILRGNRWRCDHGWDIDLDDGSTNYRIVDNICLSGGIKLREGFFRTVENNVMVNNTLHPHVWYANSHDVVRHNIIFMPYQPIRVTKPWGDACDYQLLHVPGQMSPAAAGGLQVMSGRDNHSLTGDARFRDPAHGDWRVADGSPALTLGFSNFPMNQFGVRDPGLRARARTPDLSPLVNDNPVVKRHQRDPRAYTWMGATVKNLIGLAEQSATGMGEETGVLVLDTADGGVLRPMDVIVKTAGQPTPDIATLQKQLAGQAGKSVRFTVQRDQREQTVMVPAVPTTIVPSEANEP